MTRLLLVLATLTALPFAGCASEVVLPEPVGGTVSRTIQQITGQPTYGVTIPGAPPVYMTEPDPCLRKHEAVHVEDQAAMGTNAWTMEYARQLRTCVDPVPMDKRREALPGCLKSIPLEAKAYDVQHACQSAAQPQ
jgi:hypothetical protein